MKHTYLSSLFSMYAQIAGAVSKAGKQKFNAANPCFSQVGIKFVIISPGKLYPGKFVLKNIHGQRQKEVTSHL
jgi:hypothetical protein